MSTATIEQRSAEIHFQGVDWCVLTPIGLRVLKPAFGFQEWEDVLPELTVAENGSQFGLGDWLLRGEARHGDKCAQAIDAHKKIGGRVKVKTLLEYRRVSEKMPYSTRVESVDWSIHRAVADNAPPEERAGWLHLAAENDWTVAQVEKFMRGPQANGNTSGAEANEIDRIYGPEAQAWFDETDRCLRDRGAEVPPNLPSLRISIKQEREQLDWQRNRTPDRDCDAILEMFTGENFGEKKGSPCVVIAPDNEIFWWLYKAGYHMTDIDRKQRFRLLLMKQVFRIADLEDSRQDGRKGGMTVTYGLTRKFEQRCRELAPTVKDENSVVATRMTIQEFMAAPSIILSPEVEELFEERKREEKAA